MIEFIQNNLSIAILIFVCTNALSMCLGAFAGAAAMWILVKWEKKDAD